MYTSSTCNYVNPAPGGVDNAHRGHLTSRHVIDRLGKIFPPPPPSFISYDPSRQSSGSLRLTWRVKHAETFAVHARDGSSFRWLQPRPKWELSGICDCRLYFSCILAMSCGLHVTTRDNHVHCHVLARDKFYFHRQSQTWDWAAAILFEYRMHNFIQ